MNDHHHDQTDPAELFSQKTWDERYSGPERVWSGRPNPRLVEQVGDLAPGDALDVGAGEGADSVWLAQRGWNVTSLDVSPVALEVTEQHAAEAGVRVTTIQHDLLTRAPFPRTYDLVSAQFWHPPADAFDDFRDVLGAAVRPGGTLLVVGHHPHDLSPGLRDTHGHDELMFTPDKVAALFSPDEWDVRLAEAQTRPTNRPEGPKVLTDSVVVLRRR
jgi:SAM-dependent methyltransferase